MWAGWHDTCSKTRHTDTIINLYWIPNLFDPWIKVQQVVDQQVVDRQSLSVIALDIVKAQRQTKEIASSGITSSSPNHAGIGPF